MTNTQIIEETIAFVKETLKGAEGGHDWFHIQRVFKNTLLIAKDEKVDVLVVSLGALLHDIADAKFNGGDETVGPKMASEFLSHLSPKNCRWYRMPIDWMPLGPLELPVPLTTVGIRIGKFITLKLPQTYK